MGKNNPDLKNVITVVSGLPRSGTSMMMQMLKAGGMEIVTDEIRKPDEDNPRGYFEFERVKKLQEDNSWLGECQGKAIKIISVFLFYLPDNYLYKIIFMQREMEEVLASQKVMLKRRGQQSEEISDSEIAWKFSEHLKQVGDWLIKQKNMEVLYLKYNEIIKNPLYYSKIVNEFLGEKLKEKNMVEAIADSLYRQRKMAI
ncbi:MAG: sulfotransferase domain-containing protein [Desulfobacterota bacterium]|nr:sulfotransferase domain-containing protein [Thermodesulfobacteriota bacterium]